MEHRFFPTEFVRVTGPVPGVGDGERVRIVETDDAEQTPRYLVETWDGRRLLLDEPQLAAIPDPSQDDWDRQADLSEQDDWVQQNDQAQG